MQLHSRMPCEQELREAGLGGTTLPASFLTPSAGMYGTGSSTKGITSWPRAPSANAETKSEVSLTVTWTSSRSQRVRTHLRLRVAGYHQSAVMKHCSLPRPQQPRRLAGLGLLISLVPLSGTRRSTSPARHQLACPRSPASAFLCSPLHPAGWAAPA